ncbi:MAG: UDP-N-acetylglucosamine 2-epimerase, partial [Nannocystaceae bacterium]
ESSWDVDIIAFGTHLSERHGHTVDQIEREGFEVAHRIPDCFAEDDSPQGVSEAMGRTQTAFARFYGSNDYDLLFCLGDRYEMFAAVAAAKPFSLNLAHLYGGEQTLGAIDDAFRHGITHLCRWHFAGSAPYAARVEQLTGTSDGVFNVGYLSLDTLSKMNFMTPEDLRPMCGLDLAEPTLLCTVHPETVAHERNKAYAQEIYEAFCALPDRQFLVTMPNADTRSQSIRDMFTRLASERANISAVENLGTRGYLSAMKHCAAMVGNTSSGYVEASFFPKVVIDLGERQRGRIQTSNITRTPIDRRGIVNAIRNITPIESPSECHIYGDGDTAAKIVRILHEQVLPQTQEIPPWS